jgi:hypothetical protein
MVFTIRCNNVKAFVAGHQGISTMPACLPACMPLTQSSE